MNSRETDRLLLGFPTRTRFLVLAYILGVLSAVALVAALGLVHEGGPTKFWLGGFSLGRAMATAPWLIGCAAYVIWLLIPSAGDAPVSFRRVVIRAFPFLLLAGMCAPVASDPFLYLHQGEMVLHGTNPYTHLMSSVRTPYSHLVQWDQTAPYGPVAVGLFAVAAYAAQGSVVQGTLVLKLIAVCAHVLAGRCVWLSSGEHRAHRTLAFLLNPVLLLAFVVDLHVDALMVALLIGSLYSLRNARIASALVLALAATFVKVVAVVALPLYVAQFIAKRDYRSLVLAIGLVALTLVALTITALPTIGSWYSLAHQIGITCRSIQTVIVVLGRNQAPALELATWYGRLSGLVFVLGCAGLWYKRTRCRAYSVSGVAEDIGSIVLIASLFVLSWVPWWYSALPIAVLFWRPAWSMWRVPAATFGMLSAVTLNGGGAPSLSGVGATLLGTLSTLAVLAYNWQSTRPRPSEP